MGGNDKIESGEIVSAGKQKLGAEADWRESIWVGRGNADRRASAEARLGALLGRLPELLADLDAAALIDGHDDAS